MHKKGVMVAAAWLVLGAAVLGWLSRLSSPATAVADVANSNGIRLPIILKPDNTPTPGIPTPPPQDARPKTGQHIRPKTSQFKPPPSGNATVGMPPVGSVTSDAKKSETARIDLPPEAEERPITRPKTIRIKRPDGTTARKQLTIARPADAESVTAAPVVAAMEGEEAEVGTAFSACALAAVVVTSILIYVLMAQTIASSLPFPGKI